MSGPGSVDFALLMKGAVRFITVFVYLASITGCINEDTKDLRQYIKDVNARPKGAVKPLPEIKVVESFLFQPEGLRDPFQPIEIAEGYSEFGGEGLRPDTSRRKEELESYALETLKMVGTVSMNSVLWGLVMVSDGSDAIHRVRVGNYMGRNNGKIIQITENSIELMEIVPDKKKTGAWIEQQASLVLTE